MSAIVRSEPGCRDLSRSGPGPCLKFIVTPVGVFCFSVCVCSHSCFFGMMVLTRPQEVEASQTSRFLVPGVGDRMPPLNLAPGSQSVLSLVWCEMLAAYLDLIQELMCSGSSPIPRTPMVTFGPLGLPLVLDSVLRLLSEINIATISGNFCWHRGYESLGKPTLKDKKHNYYLCEDVQL